MSQAIVTKFIPCTNTKPSRIKAFCERGSLTIGYHSQEGNEEEVNIIAAKMLCEKFAEEDAIKYGSSIDKSPWSRPFVSGQIKGGNWVHVLVK
jgi:hypothetical protein